MELEFTRRRAMRGIVKGFVIGTLGLAVLVGTAAVSFAVPKKTMNVCTCKCAYVGSPQGMDIGSTAFLTAGSCDSPPSGQVECLDSNGKPHTGSIYGTCKFKQTVTIPISGIAGVLQPLTTVPPAGVKPPAGVLKPLTTTTTTVPPAGVKPLVPVTPSQKLR